MIGNMGGMGDGGGGGLFSSTFTQPSHLSLAFVQRQPFESTPESLMVRNVMERGEELWGKCSGLGIGDKPKGPAEARTAAPEPQPETAVDGEGPSPVRKMARGSVGGPDVVRAERETTLLWLIEETLGRSREAVEAGHRQAKLADWERYRHRLAALQPQLPNLNHTLQVLPLLSPAPRPTYSTTGQGGAGSSGPQSPLRPGRLRARVCSPGDDECLPSFRASSKRAARYRSTWMQP